MAYYPVQPLPDTNARSPSITVRPSSTALLTIDSEDRYKNYVEARTNPTSPYNFVITKTENLMAGFFTRLAVTEINFPWAIPNINAKTNTMVIDISSAGQTIQQQIFLAQGFYTPNQLAEEIQATVRLVNPFVANFVMSYGTIPNFAGTAPVFDYYSGDPDVAISFSPLLYGIQEYPYPPTTKQLFDLLGFNDTNTILQESARSGYTLCQAIRYIDIVCNQITSVASLKDNTSQPVVRDMLCRVYLGDGGGTGQSTTSADASGFCPPGCAPMTIYRAFPHPKQIAWIPNQNIGGFLQFQVYDDAGDLLSTSVLSGTINSTPFEITDGGFMQSFSEKKTKY